MGLIEDIDLVGDQYQWLGRCVQEPISTSQAILRHLLQHVLLRLPRLGVSHESTTPSLTHWQIQRRLCHRLGCRLILLRSRQQLLRRGGNPLLPRSLRVCGDARFRTHHLAILPERRTRAPDGHLVLFQRLGADSRRLLGLWHCSWCRHSWIDNRRMADCFPGDWSIDGLHGDHLSLRSAGQSDEREVAEQGGPYSGY